VPPTAGTARLANDMDNCNSVVRMRGRLIGTAPMRAPALATKVRNAPARATTSQPICAAVIVFHSCDGLPTWLNKATSPRSVPIAINRFEALTRYRSWSGGTVVSKVDAAQLRSSARCLANACRRPRRLTGHISRLRPAGWRRGRVASSSSPQPSASASVTARSLPTICDVLARSSATSAARRGAVVVAPDAWSKSTRATPVDPTITWCALSRPCTTWAACSCET